MTGNTTRGEFRGLHVGWLVSLVVTFVAFIGIVSLLVVNEKLPSYWTKGPGEQDTDQLGVNFNKPTYWWTALAGVFLYNVFTTAVQKKLNLWQWKMISEGTEFDWGTWCVVMLQELLNTTAGFVTLFFGLINITFFVAGAVGKSFGVIMVGKLNHTGRSPMGYSQLHAK